MNAKRVPGNIVMIKHDSSPSMCSQYADQGIILLRGREDNRSFSASISAFS